MPGASVSTATAVGTGVSANPGEAVLQEAAGEELIHDLGDHRAPVATGRGEALVPHQAELPGPAACPMPARHPRSNRPRSSP